MQLAGEPLEPVDQARPRAHQQVGVEARDAVRARTSKARVAAATVLLAISGRKDDAALLAEGLAFAPTPAIVFALGRHGSAAA